ncbi:MAG: serine hydrolase domain-containing protein [Verrucomicrobiota bacterium]
MIKRIALIGIVAAAGTVGYPSSAEETASSLPEEYQEVGTNKAAALKELCHAAANTGLFSGAVLVADKGEIIYKEAFGLANREWNIPNTIDTKFRLASVSKQFCATLVMQLVQEGKLSLDDKITDHLHYYRKDTGDKITIHHLLSHQSGIKDYTSSFDYKRTISRLPSGKDEFIQKHCSADLIHEPGTMYAYSNAGYSILGRIIEKATLRTFEQNLQDRIFEPIAMADSGYDRNEYIIEKRAGGYTRGPFGYTSADYIDMDSSPGAAGAIYSTVEDMFLWDRALYSDEILTKKLRDKMFTPNRDVPEVKAAGGRPHSRYGYGWQIYTRTHPVTKRRTKVVSHGGAINGFRAIATRLIEDDAFVIILCNQGDPVGSSNVWNAVTNLSTELIHAVTGQPYRLPQKPRPSQEQRMYDMIRRDGIDAAIGWFKEKGRKAAWGGTTMGVADQLLEEGLVDEGIQLMEMEIELNPGKVWLYRKATEACLRHARAKNAKPLVTKALELKPEDEKLKSLMLDVERVLKQQ